MATPTRNGEVPQPVRQSVDDFVQAVVDSEPKEKIASAKGRMDFNMANEGVFGATDYQNRVIAAAKKNGTTREPGKSHDHEHTR